MISRSGAVIGFYEGRPTEKTLAVSVGAQILVMNCYENAGSEFQKIISECVGGLAEWKGKDK